MVTKGITDCPRLGPIAKLGGCGMGIQVSNCRVSESSILQREFHHPTNSSTIFRRCICVKGIRVRGVAHKLRERFGASVRSVLPLFKNNHARPFTQHKSIPLPIPWARRSLRIIVSGRERPHRGKARNRQWRYGSLAPPQIMTSASPRCMMRKASPIACAPVVRAVAHVILGPFAPYWIEICTAARLTMEAVNRTSHLLFQSTEHLPSPPDH